MSKLSLYVDSNYFSPYAMSAYVALRELNLEFGLKTIDLDAGEQRRAPFREKSGTARIPALRHEDFWLTESSAICEYLHESFSPTSVPLYPEDVRERARARQVQAWLRTDLAALRHDRPTEVIFLEERRGPMSEKGREGAEKLLTFADMLVGEDGAPMFSQWSIADVELALMLNRLVLNGDPLPARLERYARRQWDRPAIHAWCDLASGRTSARD
jgi:glutathione S-transferase